MARLELLLLSFLGSIICLPNQNKAAPQDSKGLAKFILPLDTPVTKLEVKESFEKLTEKEKLYAHYISQASFIGSLIILLQTSPESPGIFRLIHRINLGDDPDQLRIRAREAGVSDTDFEAYQLFCSAIYGNMGNYKGFGDTKIVPGLPKEEMEKIVKASKAFESEPEKIAALWDSVKNSLYDLAVSKQQLGLGDKGITTYFSSNCDELDADRVSRFLKSQKMEAFNNRVLKTVSDEGGAITYEIRNAGIEETLMKVVEDFEGATFNVTSGDYGPLLQLVNENLKQAIKHANDLEKKMLQEYILSFESGLLEHHKNGSRYWIKNKSPAIETYIGFIETYRDPVKARGEFEGFVAMVNKEQSKKFQALVDNAEELIPLLPWPKEFEVDKFLRPDFTSLDVLAFGVSSVPLGINIPNYDEIRQTEGYKNVALGNVVSARFQSGGKGERTQFLSAEDDVLFKKWNGKGYDVQVGLHELLGHGSGKLLERGNFPANLTNPLTGKRVESFYLPGETFNSVFSDIKSAYEECRAEAVGLYLGTEKKILRIFGYEGQDADDITYVNWLHLCKRALNALERFSTSTGEWTQAHGFARFAILNVLLEAGEDFVSVEEVVGDDGRPDLLLTLDRTKIESVGKPALGKFLQKLQIYKATANAADGRAMFERYTKLETTGATPFRNWVDLVVARKSPELILVQPNTVVNNGTVQLKEYEETPVGVLKSWADRIPREMMPQIDKILADLSAKDARFFEEDS